MSETMQAGASESGLNRREFIRAVGLGLGAAGISAGPGLMPAWGASGKRLKVAAIVTEFSFRSHAHVILENFLEPYLFNGERTESGMDVAALYIDQFPAKEIGREVARKYGIPIFPTIAGALTLGDKSLAVDAVLSIAEHGNYPVNAKAQREYPRKRFFDETVAVFESSGRVVPVFSDKHLSYRWDWAKEMYDTARRLKIPLMAGSSVPLGERRPPMDQPAGLPVTEAVSIHSGPLEAYDFHGLEVLQSVVESRRGGEPGVASVQFLEGDALWQAAEAGLWSPALADAAMAAELGPGQPTFRKLVATPPFDAAQPYGILVTYRDGLRGTMLKIGRDSSRWNVACRVEGEPAPRATAIRVGPWRNRNLFKALSHAIQQHFREGKSPYPVERTLLTTGALDAAMDSRVAGGKTVSTPQLAIAYAPVDFSALRETGASWKILPADAPEPPGLDPTGRQLGGGPRG
jgi:hypothetical protein